MLERSRAFEEGAEATQVAMMAGGEGKRMGFICLPKPLLRLGGTPLIDRCISYFASSGFRDFIVLTKHEEVEKHVFGLQSGIHLRTCRDPPLEESR